jgi:hypothetical protein
LPRISGSIRFVDLGPAGKIIYAFPDAEGLLSVLLPDGEFRLFTETLGPSVKSVTDGARDVLNSPFAFDGSAGHSLEVVVEP